jgi:ATP-binding cassette subfamily B protein
MHKSRGEMLKENFGAIQWTLKKFFGYYPVMGPLAMLCILFSAIVASIPAIFIQKILAVIQTWVESGDWAAAKADLMPYIWKLIGLYALSLGSLTLETQLMAVMTQGFLNKLRQELFSGMQDLPIRFFDSHQHGDIMSHYTNDIDTLRQLVSQAFPSLLQAGTIALSVFAIMLYFSVWLTLVLLVGVVFMVFVARKIGGGSARFFMRQQKSVGAAEGFVQEMMTGQKVVKVFCHEDEANAEFDKLNEELCSAATRANTFANILMPVMNNLSYLHYAVTAIVGGILTVKGIGGMTVGSVVSYLQFTRTFSQPITQVSQQLNSVLTALAGAERIFRVIDEEPEADEGYVTLVNADIAPDGTITEADHRTGRWAWKHPHKADGTITYAEVRGNVQFDDVYFGYEPEKTVLNGISLVAQPGQKIAFVGSTGAGKTTITNLINRFYDVDEGVIHYDGIDVKDIRKRDLRRSLGIVLQEVYLFTGTVMENIRYGKLDATDEECIAAAKLAGAHGFIEMLPKGYDTVLEGDGSGLSQGQRQLLSIARAAVADPPVMILDEATSSIDTRTEAIVQRGMDALMHGRTVFVIAHRLSTVRNSDVIMVLDHGKIIERGSHQKLLEEKGQYYMLYTGGLELD